ncbi:hypothetical protein [Apibacter sp. HY039]|uniref:hypothetical protein n=1 Tax=Apibacter sp. HY039 TaxID=2501476 RepID=UPI000FEB811D|nr:hypothetical protein [Apibacter sp. HY039]
MRKIFLLALALYLFCSCNGQENKELTKKNDLASINFTEKNDFILDELGFDLSKSKETNYRVLSIFGKESDFKSNFDNHFALATYGHIIKFLAPNNIYFKDFSLESDELSFHYNKENSRIIMIQVDIWNEQRGDDLIAQLVKDFDAPKTTEFTDYKVFSGYSSKTKVIDYKRKIKQTGMVWNNNNGKTYCIVKFYEKDKYLGHHFAWAKADDNISLRIMGGWRAVDKLIDHP